MSNSEYFVGNTMVARLSSLVDHNNNIVTSATVTLETLEETDGTAVTGVTLPLAMSHIASGLYEAEVSSAAAVTAGKQYYGTIKAVDGTATGEWRETLVAKTRVA